jgi:hypothetical protein
VTEDVGEWQVGEPFPLASPGLAADVVALCAAAAVNDLGINQLKSLVDAPGQNVVPGLHEAVMNLTRTQHSTRPPYPGITPFECPHK